MPVLVKRGMWKVKCVTTSEENGCGKAGKMWNKEQQADVTACMLLGMSTTAFTAWICG